MPPNKRETGKDTTLNITGDSGVADVPVTSMSYSLDAETDESQFNTSPHKSIVFTGTSYSGSFEHDGSNVDIQEAVRDNEGMPIPPENLTITIKEADRNVQFTNCYVTSRSKDMPGDGRTSESYDFVAENVTIWKPSS